MNLAFFLAIGSSVLLIIFVLIYFSVQKKVSITYGDIVVAGQSLTVRQTIKEPSVSTNVSPFTIVLFDKDAPTSKAQGLSYLHWAKSGNDVIIPYQGPTPPPLTGTHTYRFNLYNGLMNHTINEKRDEFDIDKLDSELKKFDSVYFTVDS